MKLKILVGSICIFALANLAFAQQGSLSLSAAFDKSEYQIGQPVKLTVKITNNGSAPVFVRWATADVTVESGGERIFKQKGMPGLQGKTKELEPGDSWANELNYSSESFSMPPSGSYQVTIAYKNDQEKQGGGGGTGKHGRIKQELWTGEIKTTATLKITN